MAHAKINLQRMLDWIETCLRDGTPLPDDIAIREHFGWDSSEPARTLLAELADAGKITIKGYGPTRTISLGRVRTALSAVGRVQPPIARADPAIERTAARLVEIVQRGRPARAVVAENAGKLLATVTPAPPPAPPPSPPIVAKPVKKEAVMPAKTISLPASASAAIDAVERLAKRDGIAIGMAAVTLIERGAAQAQPATTPAAPTAPLSIEALCDLIRDCFAERPDHSADLAAAIARADAADARAQQAEAKLAQAKALFA